MKKILKYLFLFLLTAVILYIYARYIEPRYIVIQKQEITSHYVSQKLENIKIVQFSDTHLSKYFTTEDLFNTVKKINSLNPDIVLFTGDLIDNYKKSSINPNDIAHILSLIDAQMGKYAIYGNHDYGGGAQRIYKKIMDNSGFTLLINEYVSISELGLSIYGLDDALFGTPAIDSISKNLDEGMYNILLCHEPDVVNYIADYSFDLAIAGHSHGEQINLPYIDNITLPALGKIYVKGLYSLNTKRDSKIYVNRGIGTSKLPLRFFAAPEITLFEFSI